MNPYGYQHYKEQSVTTMTQGEMLNLLYDELLKRLTRAELALNKKDYKLFEESLERSVEIVTYLKDTLNFNYEISADLKRMYDFFLFELSRLKAGRKSSVIEELKPLVADLRDAFKEAGRLNS